jgi:hypothetical protein
VLKNKRKTIPTQAVIKRTTWDVRAILEESSDIELPAIVVFYSSGETVPDRKQTSKKGGGRQPMPGTTELPMFI